MPDHSVVITPKGSYDIMQWLSPESVAAFSAAAKIRRIPAGGTIYSQTDPGHELFRIVTGSVRVLVVAANGRVLIHQLFGQGACIGASSLIDGEPRPQTAEAFEAVELQVIDRNDFKNLCEKFPEFQYALLRLLSRHMRLLIDYSASSSLDEVSLRLAQRLVDAADVFGVVHSRGIALPAKLSQAELAPMIGAARQTANRVIGRFRKEGLLRIERGAIVISDMPRLRAFAEKGWRSAPSDSLPGRQSSPICG